MRRVWSTSETAVLREQYGDTRTSEIASRLRRSVSAVYQKAAALGLCKSEAYLASPNACRLRRGDNVGAAFRYSKGQVPANKGLRRPGWHAGRMQETQFKKGRRPHTWKPVGSLRINCDGYLEQKVSETGYPPRDWVGVHRLVWEAAHGSISSGHVVVFRSGRRTTDQSSITLDAVELVTRAELMRRNSYHNYPQELARLVQLRGALNRQINKRMKT